MKTPDKLKRDYLSSIDIVDSLQVTGGGSPVPYTGSLNIYKTNFSRLNSLDRLFNDLSSLDESKKIKKVSVKKTINPTVNSNSTKESSLKILQIHNRRYLGNKTTITGFIRNTVEAHCPDINTVVDIFAGTGAVANAFKDKTVFTNDLLYCNYISNYAWFGNEEYRQNIILQLVANYNKVTTNESNYMRDNFANTYFDAETCSKIGFIREDIEQRYQKKEINFKEYAILVTALIYSLDRIANTVGHYDAYRKNASYDKEFVIHAILPDTNLSAYNRCYNQDANELIKEIECDLLYLDPPYNSRQYCDSYHLLENIAKWEKPEVHGVARKMDRSDLKSDYCLNNATLAFADLITNARAKYIVLSYNNMSEKGNSRSNAKISDEDIMRILQSKGEVQVFEQEYKSFTTGKSEILDNKERLFICKVFPQETKQNTTKKQATKKSKTTTRTSTKSESTNSQEFIASPLNYTGGKFKLLPQIVPLLAPSKNFVDLFAGGANVAINAPAEKIFINDQSPQLINLMQYWKHIDIDTFIKRIESIIIAYNLSNTSLYGYEYYKSNSSQGLAVVNKSGFLELRNAYNAMTAKQQFAAELIYALIVYSFNNQIRFNRNGEFNLPVGKRDFNNSMRNKLVQFITALQNKNTEISCKDFRHFNLEEFDRDTLIYCDPPYLITTATYNENQGWTEQDERDLLDYLDLADSLGLKFALSNVLTSKGQTNTILEQWLEERNYHCHYLNKDYANCNYQRKDKTPSTQEVLITNYVI